VSTGVVLAGQRVVRVHTAPASRCCRVERSTSSARQQAPASHAGVHGAARRAGWPAQSQPVDWLLERRKLIDAHEHKLALAPT
jgi:hypothetical protein